MTIKRWDLVEGSPGHVADMVEYETGDFVVYSDYIYSIAEKDAKIAELQAKCDRMEASLSKCHRDILGKSNIINLLSVDADRYKWLRDKSEPNACAFYLSVGMALHGVRFEPNTVDSFIDSARIDLKEPKK